MILAAAVIAGFIAGLARAWIGKRPYRVPSLRLPGLVLFAFVPQLFAFYLPRAGVRLPDEWAPVVLVGSQVVLLLFFWLNRKQPGFWLLGAGLLLNFLVIVSNGGLMPISPEMVRTIYPTVPESRWQVGRRLGNGKDIVLPDAETHLRYLSDRFTLPAWVNYSVAFSVGDVLIALGAFWLLWSLGGINGSEPTGEQRIPL
jgi:hypothetical protein